MMAKEVNQMALYYLASQNWQMAQQLFYRNARENPSHETYNNLGNYLIHEGITCKNGKTRSAKKIGMKYLQRASRIRTSSTNLCAIAKAYDFELRRATASERTALYQIIYELLTTAYDIMPTNETLYNILRIQILRKAHNEAIIESIKNLLTEFEREESVRLYFEMLHFYSLYDEGVCCITQYGEYLPADDLLLFYAKHQKYDEGYNLCEVVCNQYSPDKYISAAIVECCINTNHLEEARLYAQYAIDVETSISYVGKDNWLEQVFSNLSTSDTIRRELILEYLSIPPFIDTCYYFD